MRVLVVEDDTTLNHELSSMLNEKGFAVDLAADAEEALDQLELDRGRHLALRLEPLDQVAPLVVQVEIGVGLFVAFGLAALLAAVPIALAAAAGLALMVLVAVAQPIFTDDLWWHLSLGETFLREGLWPAGDPQRPLGGHGAPREQGARDRQRHPRQPVAGHPSGPAAH